MTASRMPEKRMPISRFGDAAAKDGRDEGLDHCIVASTRTTAFAATLGKSSASIKYSNVESVSSTAASLTAMACCEGAERDMTMCGGADCELRRGRCIMSK